MRFWTPWIHETKVTVLKFARFVFAALILNFLVLVNVAAILIILAQLKVLIR